MVVPETHTTRYPIRFRRWFLPIGTAVGLLPRWSWIDVGPDEVDVRMSWAFRASLPRASIRDAHPSKVTWLAGIGVHGWAGTYAVNGSQQGIVEILLDPPARARLLGFPVRLRRLFVSVDDPADLAAALR